MKAIYNRREGHKFYDAETPNRLTSIGLLLRQYVRVCQMDMSVMPLDKISSDLDGIIIDLAKTLNEVKI